MTHFLQPQDLSHYITAKDGTLTRDAVEVDRGELAQFQTPFSAPAYCGWMRVLDKTEDGVTRLLAHTMTLDVYPWGVKVHVRIGTDGTLKVITEDSEGREVVASYVKS